MSVKLYFQQNWRRDVRVFQTDHQTEFRKFSKQLKQVLKLRDNQNIVIKWQGTFNVFISNFLLSRFKFYFPSAFHVFYNKLSTVYFDLFLTIWVC